MPIAEIVFLVIWLALGLLGAAVIYYAWERLRSGQVAPASLERRAHPP